jgi:hypothetical protein
MTAAAVAVAEGTSLDAAATIAVAVAAAETGTNLDAAATIVAAAGTGKSLDAAATIAAAVAAGAAGAVVVRVGDRSVERLKSDIKDNTLTQTFAHISTTLDFSRK